MNLVRGIVVAAKPNEDSKAKLYVNPPAAVIGSGTKYKHTSNMVVYDDDVSALPGKDLAWNHHYYYGYFDVDAKGVVCTP